MTGKVRRGKRSKFRPEITRIKLNVEQAVLQCSCFFSGMKHEYFSGNHWPEIHWPGYTNLPCIGRLYIDSAPERGIIHGNCILGWNNEVTSS